MPTGRYTNHPKFCTCHICQKAYARGKDPSKEIAKAELEEIERQKEIEKQKMKNVFDVLNSTPSEEEG